MAYDGTEFETPYFDSRFGGLTETNWLLDHALWDNPSLFSDSFPPVTLLDLSDILLVEQAGRTTLMRATVQQLRDIIVPSSVGYSLTAEAAILAAPSANTTYYFGGQASLAPGTAAALAPIYIPKSGAVKVAYIEMYAVTSGSNENIDVKIRLNDTSDTLIAGVAAATNLRIFSNTGLNIAVSQGDYIELKAVFPFVWASPAQTVSFGGQIYIE